MHEIKAPHSYAAVRAKPSVFLAGSIEQGRADDWQQRLAQAVSHLDVLVLNPRRDAWDSTWEQRIENAQFREQVEWELQALEDATHIALYFAPGTQSPISLLELGLHAAKAPHKLVVCCPEGFWRKGNVDIVCQRYGVEQVSSLEALCTAVLTRLRSA